MINSVIRYFDLQSHKRDQPRGQAGSGTGLHVFPQYIAVALGIVADPYLNAYINTGTFGVTFDGLGARIVFGLIIAMAVLPAVYRSSFDPDKPTFVQFCTLFVSGLGWQALFGAAVKAAEQVS